MAKFKFLEIKEKSDVPFCPGKTVVRKNVTGYTKSEVNKLFESYDKTFPMSDYVHSTVTTAEQRMEVTNA